VSGSATCPREDSNLRGKAGERVLLIKESAEGRLP
jgi:hypothetical protein